MRAFGRERACTTTAWQGGPARPRVLVESPEAWAFADVLAEAGYAVATCQGPGEGERCPLLVGERCAAVEGADAVVSSLPGNEGAAVVRALAEHHPRLTVVAEAPRPKAALYVDATLVVDAPLDARRLLATVASVLPPPA